MAQAPEYLASGGELQLAQLDAQRKSRIADMLQKQSLETPQGGMAGRVYVGPSWTQGLGNMLQSYMADKAYGKADESLMKAKDINTQELAKYAEVLKNGVGNPAEAYGQGIASQSPDVQKIALHGLSTLPETIAKQEEHREAREFRHQERVETAADRKAAREAQNEFLANMAKERQAAGATPYSTLLQTADGVYSWDTRTKKLEKVNVDGAPVVGSVSDPALQQRIAQGKQTGKNTAERDKDRNALERKREQLLNAVGEAETLLQSNPTASGIGAGVDTVNRVIGATTDSAQKASQLETLSGWMTANVPRMEGPQSDFDVKNYQTMAAKVGDRTIPTEERLKAVKVLKGLQSKYKDINNADSTEIPETAKPSVSNW